MTETAKLLNDQTINPKQFINTKLIHILLIFDKKMEHFKLAIANFSNKEFLNFKSLINDKKMSRQMR